VYPCFWFVFISSAILLCVARGRVEKTYIKKLEERAALANLIDQKGVISKTMPYSCCFKANCVCCLASKSLCYSEYICIGKSCNGNNVAAFCRFLFSFLVFLFPANCYSKMPIVWAGMFGERRDWCQEGVVFALNQVIDCRRLFGLPVLLKALS